MGRGPTPAGCSFQIPNRSENIRTFGAGPGNQNARVLVPLMCLTLDEFSTCIPGLHCPSYKRESCNKSKHVSFSIVIHFLTGSLVY